LTATILDGNKIRDEIQSELLQQIADLKRQGISLTSGLASKFKFCPDVAGLTASYEAYHASLGGKEAPVIGGLTGDQRFFLAFAQSWREKTREKAIRGQVATDGHSPGNLRAQTVRNLDAWYPAFNVQPGQKLYLAPDKRVHVW